MIALMCTALLLAALPENSQYAPGSLPLGIARSIAGPSAGPSGLHDGIFRVRQFREPGRALWVVTLPCREGGACHVEIFLEGAKGFREVGKASGELVDADPESGIPEELSFHVPGSSEETQLRWVKGELQSKKVARWYRDPLTRERVDAAELRSRGLLDLQSGRFTAAAGRYTLLCQDPCAVLEVETLATALLEAKLFEQAEAALRKALAMPGHQAQDYTSLASLLRAEGRESEAAAVESLRPQEAVDGGG